MDKNFDELAEAFGERVYNSGKGAVRLELLQYDMRLGLPEISYDKKLKILDAGGGMGQIAAWLSSMGHDVILCDISSKMLAKAKKLFSDLDLNNVPNVLNEPIQRIPFLFNNEETFDLILLHGVIEWMEYPFKAIEALIPLLRKGGAFSILAHNLDKTILKWGINGQYANALEGKSKSVRKLTPVNSLSCKTLEQFFESHKLSQISKAGIRIFYGFFAKLTKETCSDTFLLEKKYCHVEPFASLGEHTHYILRKA